MNTSHIACTALSALTSLLLLACDGGDDDMMGDTDGGGLADGSSGIDGGGGADCPDTPTRLVVLGDSITACFGVGEKEAATCGPKIFHTSLAGSHAPGVIYENKAVSGSRTAAIPDSQLSTVTTGSGHVMALIYTGGNDIRPLLTVSDAQAETQFAQLKIGFQEDWDSIFAFFDDTANFPDGVTIVMNNQYNPFDNCTERPPNLPIGLSARKNELLIEYNTFLQGLADAHDNAVLTDQYTPYLGHGHLVANDSCPHYTAGLTGWMNDLIHPNAAGHANLALQWQDVADTWFASCQ